MSQNPSKITLYDLSLEGVQITDILEANEGELTPELEDRLQALMHSGPKCVEAAAMVFRGLEASADACANEAQRLAQRATSFHNNAERLKGWIAIAIDCAFNGKIKTDRFTLWTQAAPDHTSFDLAEGHSLEELKGTPFVREKLELDKIALKDAFKSDQPLPAIVTFEHTPGKRYARIK
jgi:hypothetical protein